MKLTYKSIPSILTLMVSLAIPPSFGMEEVKPAVSPDSSSNSGSYHSKINRTAKSESFNPSGFLTIDRLTDTFEDSCSFCLQSQGEVKTAAQKLISEKTGHTEVRRILQLDGGGVRGLFSILELCVLEAIINDPINREVKERLLQKIGKGPNSSDYLYIRDLFDVGTGTSTGSILTAGLFYKTISSKMPSLTAIDVAKLYVRYGYKIFDEQKRFSMAGIGLTCATYGNEGLSNLLALHFGNATLADVHKPIYIVALNEDKQEAAVFSTSKLSGDVENLEKTPLAHAVLYSSSAPTFLPGVKGLAGNGHAFFSDGGTVANNSAHLVLEKEKESRGNPYEIFSLGTGVTPPPVVRSVDSGALAVATILTNTLVASEKLALTKCVNEVSAISSQLQYFVRLNPQLEAGMDKLDDTSPTYVRYAIKKAFSLTQGLVFAEMVNHLGFQMPKNLEGVHEKVLYDLDTLKSDKYSELDTLEKEFVQRKIKDLDFDFYNNRHTAQGRISDEKVRIFLNELIADLKGKIDTSGFSGTIARFFGYDISQNIHDYINRGIEFHALSHAVSPLTQDQVDIIMDDGEGSDAIATQLFESFKKCCNEGATFKYKKKNASHIDVVSLIFWKDVLRRVGPGLTEAFINKLRDKMSAIALSSLNSKALVSGVIESYVRSSRDYTLINALDPYQKKFMSKRED